MNDTSLEARTENLKELIHQVNNSGKQAWIIGKNLDQIGKDGSFAPKFVTFTAYVLNELGLSANQAEAYVKIFSNFSISDITNIMLASHLLILSDLSQIQRSMLLEAMRKAESGLFDEDPLLGADMQKKMLKPPYTGQTLKIAIVRMREATGMGIAVSQEDCEKMVRSVLKEQNIIREINKKEKRAFDIDGWQGNPIQSHSLFSEIIAYHPNEPLDETGTVSLFCILFPVLCKLEFELSNQKLFFNRIDYNRARFPDAKIECIQKNGIKASVALEFEYNATKYIDHVAENAKCQLIVCWENNWTKTEIPHPPVFCLRKTLLAGSIIIE